MATKSNRSSGTQPNQRGVAQGVTLVDPVTGWPVCVKKDENDDYRLCVDTKISLQGLTLEVDLDVEEDGVHIGDKDTGNLLTINADGSINVNTIIDAKDGDNIAISGHPSPIFSNNLDNLPSAAVKQIFSYTSLSDNTRIISIECTAATPTTFYVKLNGSTIKIKRSSPAERNVEFVFREHRPLPNGQSMTVEAQVERFFTTKAPYSTFTTLEGYLCT